MRAVRRFFDTSLREPRQLGIALVAAVVLVLAPQVEPNDWEINMRSLTRGLAAYESGNYLYPPWALILLQPYRLMTAPGARVLSALVVAALAYRRGWPLSLFMATILNPYFIFSALFSNLDLLVLTFPILLWEVFGERDWLGRGIALSLLLIKPQGAFLFVLYLLWGERRRWRQLLPAAGVVAALTVPISLLGSPPLVAQWLRNLASPSTENVVLVGANNSSLTALTGFLLAVPILLVAFGGVFLLMRRFRRPWSNDHTMAALLLSSMLLSPYTSAQSIIAALAFAPSWPATLIHYLLTLIAGVLGIYRLLAPFWIIAFGVVALWFSAARLDKVDSQSQS